MSLPGESFTGPFTVLEHVDNLCACVCRNVPNIKSISRDILEHAEVIWPVLHLYRDRLCGLQHLNIHLLRCLVLHVHRVVLKDRI